MDKELDKPKLVVFDQIVKNLKEVYDPEISVNIYDLGLIYRIDLEELPKAHVTHTLTSAFCPAADQIVADIKYAVETVESVDSCEVTTTFDPPFGPEMMSEDAKLVLGIFE
jgi:metal-sulfur cluster biosynthetic enzyme